MGLHEISTSISCEIVGQNCVRGVISEAHVLENDEIRFYSVVCGRRNSLQEGFFDKLKYGSDLLGPSRICYERLYPPRTSTFTVLPPAVM